MNPIIEKVKDELVKQFKQYQEATSKKLELTNIIELEQIYDNLYNVAVRINYEKSRRKFPNHLNFTSSVTFNENKDLFNQVLLKNESEFQELIETIILNIKETLSRLPQNPNSILNFL